MLERAIDEVSRGTPYTFLVKHCLSVAPQQPCTIMCLSTFIYVGKVWSCNFVKLTRLPEDKRGESRNSVFDLKGMRKVTYT